MSSRFRIILGILILGSLGFFGLTRWMIRELRPHYLKSMEESLVDQSTLLASLLSTSFNEKEITTSQLASAFSHANEREFSAKIYDMTKERINSRIYVTNENGIVLFDSYGNHVGEDYSQWNDVYRTLNGEYGSRSSRDNEEDDNSSVLYVAAPIIKNGKIIGSLTVAKPAKSVNIFIKNSRDNVLIAVLITGMLLFIFALLFTHWVTVPIRKITGYARDIADSPARISIDVKEFGSGEHNEFRTLAIALEEMRESLEGKRYVEQYVQSLTHEIKSPLSAIRGAVELIDDSMPEKQRERFMKNISTESERITSIIERMLQLTSLEHRQILSDTETVSIESTVSQAITALESQTHSKNITINFDNSTSHSVTGELFLLQQVIINLLSNAIDFTAQGKSIDISVKIEGKEIKVVIHDSGEGIPEYALSRIFERFYSLPRPDTARKSTGLGLPFVREAIELHKGSVTLRNHENGGAEVTVSLPHNSPNKEGV